MHDPSSPRADFQQRELPDYLVEKKQVSAYDIPIRATLEGKLITHKTDRRNRELTCGQRTGNDITWQIATPTT
jgi:hypothetical protein